MRSGRLVAVRTLSELRAASPRRVTVTFSRAVCTIPAIACAVVTREPQRWVLDVEGPLGALVASLAGEPVADLSVTPFTLEDTVLRLMGEEES
jgi:hypothetical protein